MSLVNFILALSSFILKSRESVDKSKVNLKQNINQIGYKFLIGLILTATTIFSLIQLGGILHLWLSVYVNGLRFEFIAYTLVTISCIFFLYKIFHKQKLLLPETANIAISETSNTSTILDLSRRFSAGLIEGYKSSQKTLQ